MGNFDSSFVHILYFPSFSGCIETVVAPPKTSTITSDSKITSNFTNHQEEQDVDNGLDQTHTDRSWSPPLQDSWNESSSFTFYGKTRCGNENLCSFFFIV